MDWLDHIELEMRRIADDLTGLRGFLVAVLQLLPTPPETPESTAG